MHMRNDVHAGRSQAVARHSVPAHLASFRVACSHLSSVGRWCTAESGIVVGGRIIHNGGRRNCGQSRARLQSAGKKTSVDEVCRDGLRDVL